jgi:hypothetical protein
MQYYIEQKKSLKGDKINALKVEEWAIKAELEDFYYVWYTLYSDSVHSNLSALDEHIVKTANKIALAFGQTDAELCEIFKCCAYIMLNANSSMAACYNQDKKQEFDGIYGKIKNIDEKYLSKE